MTCDDFLRRLAGPDIPSREMRDHAALCESCRPLIDIDEMLMAEPLEAAPPMSRDLRDALATHRRVEPYAASWRALAPAGVLVAALGLVALFARRPDFARVPGWLVVLCAIGFLGSFAAGLALLLVRGRAGQGSSAAARGVFLGAATAAYAALTVLAVERVPGPQPRRAIQGWLAENVVPIVGAWARHLPCTTVGLVIGGAIAAAVLHAAARTAAASPRLSGAVSGAAAAMATAFVLFAYCPSHTLFHVTFVHAIPLAAVVIGGALLGRRALAT